MVLTESYRTGQPSCNLWPSHARVWSFLKPSPQIHPSSTVSVPPGQTSHAAEMVLWGADCGPWVACACWAEVRGMVVVPSPAPGGGWKEVPCPQSHWCKAASAFHVKHYCGSCKNGVWVGKDLCIWESGKGPWKQLAPYRIETWALWKEKVHHDSTENHANEIPFLFVSAEAKGRSPDIPNCFWPVFTQNISIPWKLVSLQSLKARA